MLRTLTCFYPHLHSDYNIQIALYLHNWHAGNTNNSKLQLYVEYKNCFISERYLDTIRDNKYRHALAVVRTGNTNLEVVTGSHKHIERCYRVCTFCTIRQAEDEYQFLLVCNCYTDIRERLIPRKYYKHEF